MSSIWFHCLKEGSPVWKLGHFHLKRLLGQICSIERRLQEDQLILQTLDLSLFLFLQSRKFKLKTLSGRVRAFEAQSQLSDLPFKIIHTMLVFLLPSWISSMLLMLIIGSLILRPWLGLRPLWKVTAANENTISGGPLVTKWFFIQLFSTGPLVTQCLVFSS